MAEIAEAKIEIVEKADDFVLQLFKEKLPNSYLYHNYNHTYRVVKSTKEIIENTELNVKQKEAVLLAAWLHDTGYSETLAEHEEASIKISEEFLRSQQVDSDQIELVSSLIRSTKMSVEPKNILEWILNDADASHFAKDHFDSTSEFLRQELNLTGVASYSPEEWLDENIKMFTNTHRFYTDYALKEWKPQKDKNLINLIEAKQKIEKKLVKEKTKAKLKAKYKDESPDRGIQTVFRTTLRNHIKLSDIADTKANILLSVNAIIISFALANVIPKLDSPTNRHLMLPTLILVLFSVASIIMSILSTRPNITSGEFTREQVLKRQVNILFFGNFHKMEYDDYKWAMNEIIRDKDYIYEALTKDLYLLGIVLNKKYMLLRKTYIVFMTGIIISVLSYILAFWLI